MARGHLPDHPDERRKRKRHVDHRQHIALRVGPTATHSSSGGRDVRNPGRRMRLHFRRRALPTRQRGDGIHTARNRAHLQGRKPRALPASCNPDTCGFRRVLRRDGQRGLPYSGGYGAGEQDCGSLSSDIHGAAPIDDPCLLGQQASGRGRAQMTDHAGDSTLPETIALPPPSSSPLDVAERERPGQGVAPAQSCHCDLTLVQTLS